MLDNKDKIKGYEMIKTKYEKLELEEDKLENELNELEIAKFSLAYEKSYLEHDSIYTDIVEELSQDIELIRDEIKEKEFLLQEIKVKLSAYHNIIKPTIEYKINN